MNSNDHRDGTAAHDHPTAMARAAGTEAVPGTPSTPGTPSPSSGSSGLLGAEASGGAGALLALTARALRTCVRMPSLILSPLFMSGFFLVVYEAQMSSVAGSVAPGLRYVNVLLPLCLLTTAFTGGAIAGQLMTRDIESGYHARLWLSPVGRAGLVAAPLLAGLVVLTIQATALTAVGGLLGLRPSGGLPAVLALIGATVLVGLAFLLLAAAAGLWTGSASAVNALTLVFFPLSFFTSTLVPRDRLGGWMAVAADLNPLTPPLEAMRGLLGPSTSPPSLSSAAAVVAVGLAAGIVAIRIALAHRTRTGV